MEIYFDIKIMLTWETPIKSPPFNLRNKVEVLDFGTICWRPDAKISKNNHLIKGCLKKEVGPKLFSEEWQGELSKNPQSMPLRGMSFESIYESMSFMRKGILSLKLNFLYIYLFEIGENKLRWLFFIINSLIFYKTNSWDYLGLIFYYLTQ